ncbi:unnamed protein product [Rotaria sp. Silwood1]|nr:unnamed protein product [Rotaria sp. Silwood1]
MRQVTEQFQQGKRMAYSLSIQSTTISSSLSKDSLYITSLKIRKQIFAIFIGSSIIISIIIITIILCFIDRLYKKTKKIKKTSIIKLNDINNHSPYILTNGIRYINSSSYKSRFSYQDESPTHNYTSLKSMKPVIIVPSSSSQSSSSSVDSAIRINKTHNHLMNTTYSYTPIGTSDELMPVDFDDNNNNNNDDDIHSGIELMMTTV